MFCPRCGVKTDETINYCRGCGTDLRAVTAAFAGRPTSSQAGAILPAGAPGAEEVKQPRLDEAIRNAFIGFAFLLIAPLIFVFAPAGRIWWFWMLIPAFGLLGSAAAEYVRYRAALGAAPRLPGPPPALDNELPPHRQYELEPPPSVTETTTRQLDQRPAGDRERA